MPGKDYKHSSINPHATKILLLVGFAIVISILLIIASVGLRSMSLLSDKLTQTVQENNVRSQLGYEMRHSSRERTMILHQMARTQDPFVRDELFIKFRQQGENFLSARDKIIELGLDNERQQILELQRKRSSDAGPLQYQVINLLNEDRIEEAANILFDQVIPAQNLAIESIDAFIALQQQISSRSLAQTSEEFDDSLRLIIILTLSGVLIGALVSGLVLLRTNYILQALYNSELREKVIRENIVDAVVTFDRHGIIRSCNKAIKDIFGYEPDELVGEEIVRLISVLDITYSSKDIAVSRLANVMKQTRQVTGIHKNGDEISLHIGISKVIINDKPVYIAVMSDMTDQINAEESLRKLNEELESRVEARTSELLEANEKLKYLASHDMVTKLPNRALLNEHLNHILASADRLNHKVALLFMDIDGFKQINDAYGHEVGDFLLKEIGSRISDTLRQSDLVSRIGGDEFIVVLDDVSSDSPLESIAHKLIDVISKPFNIKNHVCKIGVSIGISIYPQDGIDIETLISRADQAMYKIKSTGKNNLYFYKNMADG